VTPAPIIAIVDDDASVRRALQRLVETAGYPVQTFASAREFLEWLPHGHASCLLLDVHMDGISGFDLVQRLAVPVIFVTAHDDALTLERIARAKAAGHLRKPIDGQAVLHAIRTAVDGQDQGPRGNAGPRGLASGGE
jgi:FixJ family two-component response regulator